MDIESLQRQFDRMERKVDSLKTMVMVQSVALIAIVLFSNVLNLWKNLIFFGVIAFVVLYFFRPYLPQWARWAARTIASLIQGRSKPGDQIIS